MKNATALLILLFLASEVKQDNIKVEFEKRYAAWRDVSLRMAHLSSTEWMGKSSEFRAIVEMGPKALPLIIEKKDPLLTYASLGNLARIDFKRRFDQTSKRIVFPDFPEIKPGEDLAEYWWRTGRKRIPAKFEEAYVEWKRIVSDGETADFVLWTEDTVMRYGVGIGKRKKNTAVGEAYEKMRNLGIDILPLIIEKVKNNDYSLLPLLGDMTDGRGIGVGCTPEMNAKVALKWWEANKKDWLLPPPEGMGEDWYLEALKEAEQSPAIKPADGKEAPPAPEKPVKTPDKPDAK